MRQRGVTLIEIMVAVAILGLMSALAVPNLINFRDNLRVHAAVNEVVTLAHMGRAGAMQSGQRYVLAIVYGSTATASDDAITLFANAPSGGIDVSTISAAAMVNAAAPPSGMVFVRNAEMAASVGIGPVGGLPINFAFPWKNVPHASLCTFCNGRGAVYFEPDGTIKLTDGTAPGVEPPTKSGSISISPQKDWSGSLTNRTYAIYFVGQTGATRAFSAVP